MSSEGESVLCSKRNVLIWLGPGSTSTDIEEKFFGTVVKTADQIASLDFAYKNVYICGDAALTLSLIKGRFVACTAKVVEDLAENIPENHQNRITSDELPTKVFGVGVFYNKMPYLPRGINLFSAIQSAHTLQDLRESDKEGVSFRKGIYLSDVDYFTNGDLMFNVLRCSTNLDGPTDRFTCVDKVLLEALNTASHNCFDNAATINHVLLQRYENKNNKKAAIKEHSDKSEDMPSNAVMAFVTTYDPSTMPPEAKQEGNDWKYKKTSVLTRLQFRLKEGVTPTKDMPDAFDVLLYPDSVLFIPLSTNRLYTHCTKASVLPFDKIPERSSYVARCSNVQVLHCAGDNTNYVIIDPKTGKKKAMQPITEESKEWLRNKYLEENRTAAVVDYGSEPILFSMNKGDYLKPNV